MITEPGVNPTSEVRNAPADEALIELIGVTKTYGSSAFPALSGVDLRVTEGEFVAVMGPSGSGKSTILNIIGCLDVPTCGTYKFRGIPIERLSRDQRALLRRYFLGFVFQGFNLLPRTTALENVELPLLYRRLLAAERRESARTALSLVGLNGWETHTPSELSGGQQQRVAIARALVANPALLLADEPTGNLDSQRGREIMELIRDLRQARGITVLIVTHDAAVSAFADRTVRFMDGRIEADTDNRGHRS